VGGLAFLARENFGSDRSNGVKDQQSIFRDGKKSEMAFYFRTVGRRRCEEWDVFYVRSGSAFVSCGTLALGSLVRKSTAKWAHGHVEIGTARK
jgi:hypothetical protein